jgi:hypothetical protein
MTWWERLMHLLEAREQAPPPGPGAMPPDADPDDRLYAAEQQLDYFDAELERLRGAQRRRAHQTDWGSSDVCHG